MRNRSNTVGGATTNGQRILNLIDSRSYTARPFSGTTGSPIGLSDVFLDDVEVSWHVLLTDLD